MRGTLSWRFSDDLLVIWNRGKSSRTTTGSYLIRRKRHCYRKHSTNKDLGHCHRNFSENFVFSLFRKSNNFQIFQFFFYLMITWTSWIKMPLRTAINLSICLFIFCENTGLSQIAWVQNQLSISHFFIIWPNVQFDTVDRALLNFRTVYFHRPPAVILRKRPIQYLSPHFEPLGPVS